MSTFSEIASKKRRGTRLAQWIRHQPKGEEPSDDDVVPSKLNASIRPASNARRAEATFLGERSLRTRKSESDEHVKLRNLTDSHKATIRKLSKWQRWQQECSKSPIRTLLNALHLPPGLQPPSEESLRSLFAHLFEPFDDIKGFVCDFHNQQVHVRTIEMIDLDSYFHEKPPEVSLRWIYVPRVFTSQVGSITWDVYRRFRESKSNMLELPIGPSSHFNHTFMPEHLDETSQRYRWLAAICVTEIRRMGKLDQFCQSLFPTAQTLHEPWPEAPLSNMFPIELDRDSSGLPSTESNFYLGKPSINAPICVSRMQSFPRDDGILLSFGNNHHMALLCKQLKHESRGQDLRFFAEIFDDHMIRDQSDQEVTVDWFMIYLKVSLCTLYDHAFHRLRGSLSLKTKSSLHQPLLNAYTSTTRQLIKQRSKTARGEQARQLVLKYVKCMDEMRDLMEHLSEATEWLKEFPAEARQWINQIRSTDRAEDFFRAEMMDYLTEMSEAATGEFKYSIDELTKYTHGLKSSLDVVFQLRTLETNEATLLAESNNRAILVFTVITIIFLPLSFFTSYFGMNLSDIREIDRSQRFFWAVCGTSTIVICALTLVFGFKERLGSKVTKAVHRSGLMNLDSLACNNEEEEDIWAPSDGDLADLTKATVSSTSEKG